MKFKWTLFHSFLAIGIFVFLIEIVGYIIDFIAAQDPGYTVEAYNRFADFAYGIGMFWPIFVIVALTLWLITYGIQSYPGIVWLLITIGLFIWGLADYYYPLRWFIYMSEDYEELNPARFLYVTGYLIMIIGLVMQLRVGHTKLSKSNYIILGIIAVVIIGLSLAFVIIPLILYPISEDVTLLTKTFLILYSIMDVIIILLIILLIFCYQGGQFAISWLIIGIGFLLMALFDLQNAYIGYLLADEFTGTFWYDNLWYLMDNIYNISYLLIALGALNFRRSVKNV